MKKIFFAILLIICGCSDNVKKYTEIDPDAYGYEARYNLVSNSFAKDRNLIELEEGLLYFPIDYKEQIQYMIYIKDNDYQLANADIGSKCDFDNLNSCTGSFGNEIIYQNFNYYMGQIYYLSNVFNEETEINEYYLGRCDLDGGNKENLIKLIRNDKTYQEYSISITFHKGMAYYTFGDNELYAINLETMKDEKVVSLNDESKIYAIYMTHDVAYVVADFYEEDGNTFNNAILKVDLKDYKYVFYQSDMAVYLIDKDNIIYADGNKKTQLYNMKSKQTKELINGLSIYKVSSDNYYLLDNSDETLENAGIYLFDKEGNQLDYLACNDFHFGYGIIDDKYYFMNDDQLCYYEIADGKFQELYTFDFK